MANKTEKQQTHWDECYKVHLGCAQVKIAQLEARLNAQVKPATASSATVPLSDMETFDLQDNG